MMSYLSFLDGPAVDSSGRGPLLVFSRTVCLFAMLITLGLLTGDNRCYATPHIFNSSTGNYYITEYFQVGCVHQGGDYTNLREFVLNRCRANAATPVHAPDTTTDDALGGAAKKHGPTDYAIYIADSAKYSGAYTGCSLDDLANCLLFFEFGPYSIITSDNYKKGFSTWRGVSSSTQSVKGHALNGFVDRWMRPHPQIPAASGAERVSAYKVYVPGFLNGWMSEPTEFYEFPKEFKSLVTCWCEMFEMFTASSSLSSLSSASGISSETNSHEGRGGGKNTGLIIGVGVASAVVVLGLLLVFILLWCCGCLCGERFHAREDGEQVKRNSSQDTGGVEDLEEHSKEYYHQAALQQVKRETPRNSKIARRGSTRHTFAQVDLVDAHELDDSMEF